ncbi:MAG TPA: ATP-binding protein [Verrucomicrobiae bacterium]|jgi:PAS domain S-box-containing protein|nr:ATP-binding protein [Verrucomicrobiae bacterium]
MKFFHNIPIKQKLIVVILLANVVTLCLTLLVVFTFQWFQTGQAISQDLRAQGEIIAANSTAALAFKDPDTAAQTLAALQAKRHVLGGALYLPNGSSLASFGRAPAQLVQSNLLLTVGFHHDGPHLVLTQPVKLNGKSVGALFLRFDFQAMQAEVNRTYLVTLGLILPMALLLALLLSSSLQRVVSEPIQQLAETARHVTSEQNYALRARSRGSDELGALTLAFNQMLARIQDQDQALRLSEARYRLLFDSNPIPMYVSENGSLKFLAANDATVARYGYSHEELLAMTIKDIRPPEDADRVVRSAAASPPLAHTGEWRHQTKEGRLLDVDITTHALEFGGRPARLVLAVDISERKKAEAALHHRLDLEKAVSEISARFINLPAAEIDDGIRWALGVIGVCKGADLSWVAVFSENGGVAQCVHQWSDPAHAGAPGWPEKFDGHAHSWWMENMRQLRAIHVGDALEWPPSARAEAALMDRLQIQSVAAVPLRFGGQAMGFLGLASRAAARRWTDDNVTVLELVAQIIVSALDRKRAGVELENVHAQLVSASRQAGMAEVATGVLHNVGNVLNSVNVSTTLIHERLRKSEVATLVKVAAILKENADDLSDFLTHDARGKAVPGFIIQLAEHLGREHADLQAEHAVVARNIEHIKEIVAMQQNYARVSGVLEQISFATLLDDALAINRSGLAQQRIEVRRDYHAAPLVMVDKHKALQILVNLISNAKGALVDDPRPDKKIILGLRPAPGERVQVTVQDNGIGITAENLTRIFGHGFTTRKKGHGFGLHSGANAAKEMGGSLSVYSAGPGTGAIFTLELPLRA